jgi:hypothetical protein
LLILTLRTGCIFASVDLTFVGNSNLLWNNFLCISFTNYLSILSDIKLLTNRCTCLIN